MAGFTRLELVAALAGLTLIGTALSPSLSGTTGVSNRAVCGNNLRQLGRALQSWTGDHGLMPPWFVPIAKGGTGYTSKSGNLWYELTVLTNHISPRVFTCPADMRTDPSLRVSPNWAALWTNRASSISYHLGLHVSALQPEVPAVLFTDRNTRFDSASASCIAGVNNAHAVFTTGASMLQWTNAVHGDAGHLLLFDGSLEFTSTPRLRELVLRPVYYNEISSGDNAHFLKAR